MSDERYGKCDVCRFCSHSADRWSCLHTRQPVSPKDSCSRYRPGFCENCTHAQLSDFDGTCLLTGEAIFTLGVCDRYDPCGRNSLGPQ